MLVPLLCVLGAVGGVGDVYWFSGLLVGNGRRYLDIKERCSSIHNNFRKKELIMKIEGH